MYSYQSLLSTQRMPDIYILLGRDLGYLEFPSMVISFSHFSNRPPSKRDISLSPKKTTLILFLAFQTYYIIHACAWKKWMAIKWGKGSPWKSNKPSLSTTPTSISKAFLQLFEDSKDVVPKPDTQCRRTVRFFISQWSSQWTSTNFTILDNAGSRKARQPAAPTSPPCQPVWV